MRNRKTSLLLVALLSITLLATGCPQGQLKKAANIGQTVTEELGEFQNLVINLNHTSKLGDEQTASLIRGVLKANSALQTAKNTVASIQQRMEAGGELTPQDKLALRDLFNLFYQAVTELNQSEVLGVKNPDSKAQLEVVLRTVLQLAQTLIALWQ